MKKQLINFRNIFGFLALVFSLSAVAQNSTVSFTIQDPTGQAFANGTLSYVIVPTGSYIFNGSPLSNSYYSPQTIILDGSGSGSVTLPRNDYITPINSQWLFTACPNASSPCTTTAITINQATQNISSVINALVPSIKIPISSAPRAYSDSEVQTTVAAGGIYYNVLIPGLRLWSGSSWSTIGGGGGGGVSTVTSTSSTLLVTNPTTTPDVEINYAHNGTYTGSQSFSNGGSGSTLDTVQIDNDPTAGEGVYLNSAGSQVGGILSNSISGGLTIFSTVTSDQFAFCITSDCLGTDLLISETAGTPATWLLSATSGDLEIGGGGSGTNVGGVAIGGSTTGNTSKITIPTTNTTLISDNSTVELGTAGAVQLAVTPSGATVTGSLTVNGTAGVGGGAVYSEGTASSGVAANDIIQAISSVHRLEMNLNNGINAVIPGTSTTAATSGHLVVYAANGYDIADGGAVPTGGLTNTTTTPSTTSIAAASGGVATCDASATTVTITGVATTMTVNFTPNSDPTGVAGWDSGNVFIAAWPSATNTISYKRCNSGSSATGTLGSITFNVSAK